MKSLFWSNFYVLIILYQTCLILIQSRYDLFYFSVVLSKFQQGLNDNEDLISNSSPINHWYVDKINIIADISEDEEPSKEEQ